MKIVYVTCPTCSKEFYIGEEFLRIPEAYCHCPYCAREFKPQESKTPLRY